MIIGKVQKDSGFKRAAKEILERIGDTKRDLRYKLRTTLSVTKEDHFAKLGSRKTERLANLPEVIEAKLEARKPLTDEEKIVRYTISQNYHKKQRADRAAINDHFRHNLPAIVKAAHTDLIYTLRDHYERRVDPEGQIKHTAISDQRDYDSAFHRFAELDLRRIKLKNPHPSNDTKDLVQTYRRIQRVKDKILNSLNS